MGGETGRGVSVASFRFRVRVSKPANNGRKKSEEVADFLIFHRDSGILVQQKCQEDPTFRSSLKTELWARKNAKNAWSQLRRAFTRRKGIPVWCDHPRLGHVEFRNGLPPIQHGVVLVEVPRAVDLQPDANDLPLDHNGVPITYLSVNDFLNLAVQLRSLPELTEYLMARRLLPRTDLYVIGDEEVLFSFYLLNNGSFGDCTGRSHARAAVSTQQDLLRKILERKYEADRYASLLEHVADQLANRNPEFANDLSPEFVSAYDPTDQRTNYREMQAALADLRLRERAELGHAFRGTMEQVANKNRGFTFVAARLDSMPDWVYVFGSSKNIDRPELLSRMTQLMRGAMTFYTKDKCLVVVDRDSKSYEVAMSRPAFTPISGDMEMGQRLFGNLRVTSTTLPFVPDLAS